jgi:AcrR family transcriptional regulator
VPRTRSPQRTDEILEAALQVFLVRGYQRTRMTDVAAEAQVSPGLLYTYAASKEALFHLVLRRELGEDLTAIALPVPDPGPDAVQAVVRDALREVSSIPTLERAAEIGDPADARAELEAIIGEHYDNLHRYRRVIRLVERSSLDWPDLADRYYQKGRRPFVRRLGAYIERRIASGHFTAVPDADVAARYVIEVVAWFAMHRYGDHDGVRIDDDIARETVVELATRSFGPTTAMT